MEKARILIIDDDPGLRKTLVDILNLEGYEIVAAESGAEGLAMLKEGIFSVVLIDLGLPDLSGIEVLNRIKSDAAATEAIILTGNATLDSAIEATNQGAFSYLLKPYDPARLLQQIRRAVCKQRSENETARQRSELQRINAELRTLYDVAKATKSLDLDTLLTEILQTLRGLKLFPFEFRGAIFLVEGETAHLTSSVNLSHTALDHCRNVPLGECLCGLAAKSGELVVSANSHQDVRHSICTSAEPHGHVIVPLKSTEKVVGVLCLYLQPTVEVEEEVRGLLLTVGEQIGAAVENARIYEETKKHSYRDPLTRLGNRRLMEVQLDKSLEQARRHEQPLSIIMMDLDRFKDYNDAHGHVGGDKLLVNVAEILLRWMRHADYIFRYGGEEFLLLLPNTELSKACHAAERLRKAVEAESGVTISLGVASFRGKMEGRDQLIRRADEALYRAKEGGRNRVCFRL